jgi:hypothetical protein
MRAIRAIKPSCCHTAHVCAVAATLTPTPRLQVTGGRSDTRMLLRTETATPHTLTARSDSNDAATYNQLQNMQGPRDAACDINSITTVM